MPDPPPDQPGPQKSQRDWYEKVTLGTAIVGVITIVVSTVLAQCNDTKSSAQVANAISEMASLSGATQNLANIASDQEADASDLATSASNQASSAGDQALSAKRQLVTSEATAERQLRAYVFVRVRPVRDFAADKVPKWGVTVDMIGQTPAYNLTVRGVAAVLPFPNQTVPTMKSKEAPSTFQYMLFPGDDVGSDFSMDCINGYGQQVKGCTLSRERFLEASAANTARLYVMGTVDYQDAFNKARHVPFCFTYNPNVPEFFAQACQKTEKPD
jgi:hypothetical protein